MKIGIIGIGLIGGSILRNLSEKAFEIYAVSRNKRTLKEIENIVTSASSDYSILKNCDIVFVCTPIDKTVETLDILEGIVRDDCIVTDVASVKGFLTDKKRPYKYIPSHPMAGTENSGFDASFKELFRGAKWVLTPYYCYEYEKLEEIIKLLGAFPITASAKEHDEAVALISHMPMYIAQSLFKVCKDNKLAMRLASSGFRDTTRLAMTKVNLAIHMFKYNGEKINIAIEKFFEQMQNLKKEYTPEELAEIAKLRREMYSKEGKNITF